MRGSSSSVTRNSDGWQPWMGTASNDAADEAEVEAKQLAHELMGRGIVAAVKVGAGRALALGVWDEEGVFVHTGCGGGSCLCPGMDLVLSLSSRDVEGHRSWPCLHSAYANMQLRSPPAPHTPQVPLGMWASVSLAQEMNSSGD